MQHVVFWSSVSGPAFERVPDLDDAVLLVQRLRNDHDVVDAEVHALTAVPLNFRTVVVVEPAYDTDLAPAFDEPAREISPLGSDIPGVVPDPVGPFTSFAVVGTGADTATVAGPHLVGLPSVSAEDHEDHDHLDGAMPALHALNEAVALAETELEQGSSHEPAPEAPVRSLGLFA